MNRELRAKIVLKFGSQSDAAREMGLSEPRLSRIINGRVEPKIEELAAFRDKLGVELGPAQPVED